MGVMEERDRVMVPRLQEYVRVLICECEMLAKENGELEEKITFVRRMIEQQEIIDLDARV